MENKKYHFVKGVFNYRIIRKNPNNHFELVCKISVFCEDAKRIASIITDLLNNEQLYLKKL